MLYGHNTQNIASHKMDSLPELLPGLGLDSLDGVLSPLRNVVINSTNGIIDCHAYLVDLRAEKQTVSPSRREAVHLLCVILTYISVTFCVCIWVGEVL